MSKSPASNLVWKALKDIHPNPGNARVHPPEQVEDLARSIERVGIANPIQVNPSGMILAGHGRYLAAQYLNLKKVPCLVVDLPVTDERAYVLADNQIPSMALWDTTALAEQLDTLANFDDVTLSGFSEGEYAELHANWQASLALPKTKEKAVADEAVVRLNIHYPAPDSNRVAALITEFLSANPDIRKLKE